MHELAKILIQAILVLHTDSKTAKNCEHTCIEGYNIPEKSATARPSLCLQHPVVLLFRQGGSVHFCCHGAARGDIPSQIRPGAAQILR